MNNIVIDETLLNRFEVIDETGRVLVTYDKTVQLLLQDQGNTLKVVLKRKKLETGFYWIYVMYGGAKEISFYNDGIFYTKTHRHPEVSIRKFDKFNE